MIKSDDNIQIIKTDDGYIVLDNQVDMVGEHQNIKVPRQDVSVISEESDREALSKVLEQVAELCGYSYDRWGKENLRISWDKKGHKVEDDEE